MSARGVSEGSHHLIAFASQPVHSHKPAASGKHFSSRALGYHKHQSNFKLALIRSIAGIPVSPLANALTLSSDTLLVHALQSISLCITSS